MKDFYDKTGFSRPTTGLDHVIANSLTGNDTELRRFYAAVASHGILASGVNQIVTEDCFRIADGMIEHEKKEMGL